MRNKNISTNDSRRFLDWLERAENDLETAKILKSMSKDNSNAAFHCQQCIEKALKAYLLFEKNIHFDGHNLTFLCRQAMQIDITFSDWLDESADLNRYYIETRYPTDIGFFVDDEQLKKIYNMAKTMFLFIKKHITIKINEK